jgi:hypothetical protein
LAAKICGQIKAQSKFGISVEHGLAIYSHPAWGRFANTQLSRNQKIPFHSLEILAKANGLPVPKPPIAKVNDANTIVLQVTSSEAKKTVDFEIWQSVIQNLKSQGYKVQVLSTDTESTTLAPVFGSDLLIGEFSDFAEAIKGAKILVSVDTALLHLSALLAVPSVAIYLGSGNAYTNFPYIAGARVLVPTSECYPCSHSVACPYQIRKCAETLNIENLAQFIVDTGARVSAMNRFFTQIINSELNILSMEDSMNTVQIERSISRAVWDMFLNKSYQEEVAPYGSFANRIADDVIDRHFILRTMLNRSSDALKWIEEFQQQIKTLHSFILNPQANSFDQFESQRDSLTAKFEVFEKSFPEFQDESANLKFTMTKKHDSAFAFYRNAKDSCSELETLLSIRVTLLSKAIMAVNEKMEAKNLCLKN